MINTLPLIVIFCTIAICVCLVGVRDAVENAAREIKYLRDWKL